MTEKLARAMAAIVIAHNPKSSASYTFRSHEDRWYVTAQDGWGKALTLTNTMDLMFWLSEHQPDATT